MIFLVGVKSREVVAEANRLVVEQPGGPFVSDTSPARLYGTETDSDDTATTGILVYNTLPTLLQYSTVVYSAMCRYVIFARINLMLTSAAGGLAIYSSMN